MAATYLILAAGELLHGPERIEWPRCLHLTHERLWDRQPGTWVVQILDDDAPPELEGKQVELVFTRGEHGLPQVAERREVRW